MGDLDVAPPLPSSTEESNQETPSRGTRRPWRYAYFLWHSTRTTPSHPTPDPPTPSQPSTHRLPFPPPHRRAPSPPPPASGYLTLIPLSDARLQPRDTRLTAAFLTAFALFIAAIVFISVPRSVTLGDVSVAADRMSWNTSKASYQLRLVVTLPVYNPNYLAAKVEGELKVLFYMAEAGRQTIQPMVLRPRALPKLVQTEIDASDVPADYILSILSQCSTFPEVLVFFLRGHLSARYLFQTQRLSTVDTYFLIDCKDGSVVTAEMAAAVTQKNTNSSSSTMYHASVLGVDSGDDRVGKNVVGERRVEDDSGFRDGSE